MHKFFIDVIFTLVLLHNCIHTFIKMHDCKTIQKEYSPVAVYVCVFIFYNNVMLQSFIVFVSASYNNKYITTPYHIFLLNFTYICARRRSHKNK